MPASYGQRNVYHAKRVAEGWSLSLDGCGGDEGWQIAHVLTDFSFPWTHQDSHVPSSFGTIRIDP